MSTQRDEGDPCLKVRKRRREVHVAVAIWEDRRLKLKTRAVLPYLLHLDGRPKWETKVSHVCSALGISRGVWTVVRKDMQEHGYYQATKHKNQEGRWVWQHLVTDLPWQFVDDEDPIPSPQFPVDGNSSDGNSSVGKPGNKQEKPYSRDLYKKHEEAERAGERGGGAPTLRARAPNRTRPLVTKTKEAKAQPEERGTRIPPDWQPDATALAWGAERLTPGELELEVEKFRDYWISTPSPRGMKTDWAATWRNWLRRVDDF